MADQRHRSTLAGTPPRAASVVAALADVDDSERSLAAVVRGCTGGGAMRDGCA
mgnify:FL=1